MALNKIKIAETAQKLAGKGQFEKAIAEYRKITQADPGDIRTWLKIGDLYTRMGARSEATETYLRVADQYRNSGFHLKAVAIYKQIVKLDPLAPRVYELLGEAYISLGLTSDALKQFEHLVELASRLNNRRLLLASLSKIVQMDNNNVAAHLRLGEELSADGQTSEAVSHLLVAYGRLKTLGRDDDYLKVAERILYIDPSQIDLVRETAAQYLKRQEPKRALTKLQILFSRDRRDPWTLEKLAEAFIELGQSDKAVSVYTELITVSSQNGDLAKKEQYCRNVLQIDPGNRMASRELGSVSVKAPFQVEEEASASFADTDLPSPGALLQQQSAPNDTGTSASKLLEEVTVLIKYGLTERAIQHFDKIFATDYYHLDAREQFKNMLLEQGDREGAKEQLFILVSVFRNDQPEAAVYYLHQILEIDPSSRRARDILRDIGGILPEGLPDLDHEDADSSGLLPATEVILETDSVIPETISIDADDASPRLSIDDIPYVDDSIPLEGDLLDGADYLIEDETTETPAPPLPRPSMMSNIPLPRPSIMPGLSLPPPKPTSVSPGAPIPRPSTPEASIQPHTTPASPDPASAASATPDISEEISEVRFFLEQGLTDDARTIYETLQKRYPGHEQLLGLRSAFDGQSRPSRASTPDLPSASAMLGELSEALHLDEVTSDQAAVGVEEVLTQFKAGVEAQVSRSDHSTHFDLGQAYKDMGLFDDAIGEFQIAAEDHDRQTSALLMVGMCHVGAGRFEEAITVFEQTLQTPALQESEKMALMYETAKVFELMNRTGEALDLYNDILNMDPGFADVVDRIDALE